MNHDERDFDDLARLWQGQTEPGAVADGDRLVDGVRRKARKFERTIFWRDAREVLGGILGVVVMARVTLRSGDALPLFGLLVFTLCMAGVLTRLIRSRRGTDHSNAGISIVDHLRREMQSVDIQIGLLSTVRTWYVLPLLGGTLFCVLTLLPSRVESGNGGWGVAVLLAFGVGGLLVLLGYGIERLNHNAVRETLEPYRRELASLLEDVEAA